VEGEIVLYICTKPISAFRGVSYKKYPHIFPHRPPSPPPPTPYMHSCNFPAVPLHTVCESHANCNHPPPPTTPSIFNPYFFSYMCVCNASVSPPTSDTAGGERLPPLQVQSRTLTTNVGECINTSTTVDKHGVYM
jgi:hypothetical protein